MIEVVSTVTICTLESPLDLHYLSKNMESAILPKKIGIWVKYRMKPENYFLIFYKSGKFLITGIKSLERINATAQQALKLLENAGIHCSITKIAIANITCLGTLQLKTSLEKMVLYLDSGDVSYEPEQFPGLIYKNWGATFLIFSTGKVIITGVKDFEKAKILFKKLEELINL